MPSDDGLPARSFAPLIASTFAAPSFLGIYGGEHARMGFRSGARAIPHRVSLAFFVEALAESDDARAAVTLGEVFSLLHQPARPRAPGSRSHEIAVLPALRSEEAHGTLEAKGNDDPRPLSWPRGTPLGGTINWKGAKSRCSSSQITPAQPHEESLNPPFFVSGRVSGNARSACLRT